MVQSDLLSCFPSYNHSHPAMSPPPDPHTGEPNDKDEVSSSMYVYACLPKGRARLTC